MGVGVVGVDGPSAVRVVAAGVDGPSMVVAVAVVAVTTVGGTAGVVRPVVLRQGLPLAMAARPALFVDRTSYKILRLALVGCRNNNNNLGVVLPWALVVLG